MQSLNNLLRHAFLEVQKALHELAVDEAKRFVRLADLVAEGAVGQKGNVARGWEERGEGVLEVDEQGLGAGREEGEEVDGSFDLEEKA